MREFKHHYAICVAGKKEIHILNQLRLEMFCRLMKSDFFLAQVFKRLKQPQLQYCEVFEWKEDGQ